MNLFSRKGFDQVVLISLIKTNSSIPVELVVKGIFRGLALVDDLNSDGFFLDLRKDLK